MGNPKFIVVWVEVWEVWAPHSQLISEVGAVLWGLVL